MERKVAFCGWYVTYANFIGDKKGEDEEKKIIGYRQDTRENQF